MAHAHDFRLFNTSTRTVEPLSLKEQGHLRFYSCGPTVYSTAHIGNFRSFLTADLIYRVSNALGWKTSYVTNITDVGHLTDDDVADGEGEDRMARALQSKEGHQFANVWDLARFYTAELLADWKVLNLLEPTVRPRATEHMQEQIRVVAALLERGHAYETTQGVYFSVPSFPGYGRLSGNEAAEGLEQLVRDVVSDPEKRDPRDFALWKKDDKHLMQWHSPWGWGFPGWHVECSAMASAYLGDELDLHAGGEDLIFPHHECEIAQAESLSDKPFARHWVHTRFLQVEGEKMAKRTGNFFTVRDLTAPVAEGGRGIDPLAVRLTLLSGHYRKPFNFTLNTLKANIRHVERFRDVDALVAAAESVPVEGDDRVGARLAPLFERIRAALLDDLNTPEAIAATIEGMKLLSGMKGHLNSSSAASARDWLDQTNALLGIIAHDRAEVSLEEAPKDPDSDRIDGLVADREAARKAKDFARADELRDQIVALGVELMDSPEGTRWRRNMNL